MAVDLSEVCNVQITLESSGITRAGYGTPMIAAQLPAAVKALWGADVVRTYTRPSDMLAASDGWLATDPAYLMAVAVKSQEPSPATFKIGRRIAYSTQVVTLTPTSFVEGTIYSGTVNALAWTYTVLAADTDLAAVAAKLVTAINAVTGIAAIITATATGSPANTVTCTADAAGKQYSYTWGANLTFSDATTDANIATDLAAIQAADSDWYGLLVDEQGEATITAASAWVAANKVALASHQSGDSDIAAAPTTDVHSALKTLAYSRVGIWPTRRRLDVGQTLAAGILAQRLTATPGSDTWHLKNIVGATPDEWTAAERAVLKAKGVNRYETLGTKGRTFEGKVASGEYYDVIRFLDWVDSTLQEDVVALLTNVEKLMFTNEDISSIEGVVRADLKRGQDAKGISKDVAPVVTVPKSTDVSTANKAARTLPDIEFSFTLAGAIHYVNPIRGRVSV
jgi:hypothetical protein